MTAAEDALADALEDADLRTSTWPGMAKYLLSHHRLTVLVALAEASAIRPQVSPCGHVRMTTEQGGSA